MPMRKTVFSDDTLSDLGAIARVSVNLGQLPRIIICPLIPTVYLEIVAEMMAFIFLLALLPLFTQAIPRCYPLSSEWASISFVDCVDIFEQILGDRMAMIPFPLTIQQEVAPFPYVRTSGTCRLRIDLLQEDPRSNFTLFSATITARDIIRSCLLQSPVQKMPAQGGQASAGPNSTLSIILNSNMKSEAPKPRPSNPQSGSGPHGTFMKLRGP